MPFIAGGTFVLGLVISYFLFARSAANKANSMSADLEAAKGLLDEAQKEREQLKQKVADLEYQLKEVEKDLAYERSKS
jgi:septal ring factor EnvC (AmiA/AmiB activator)